ncbi:hypothetical protein PILCRDRAFT_3221 [Piloderma croceum F 1598]|uniref:Uncharacterized protein n=1 Tax=Piloderma croceum (strain F 1598) TaxID=765440 RepID=A0A0C3GC17_PILCF|nr:hypothetical protein PILCRDRAFT_3221 [Piloderma croceum F 1598]
MFSVPNSTATAGRNSFTTTFLHVPLRGGDSSTNILNSFGGAGRNAGGGGKRMTMAIFPPSLLRNRRRLRKKLRPPHLYDNVFEMVEDFRDRDSPVDHDMISSPSPPAPPLPPSTTTSPNQPTPPNPAISSPPSAFFPSSSPPSSACL